MEIFLVHVSLNLLNVGVEKTVGLCQGCYHISYKWKIVQCFLFAIATFYLSYDTFAFACVDKRILPNIAQNPSSYTCSSVCVTYLYII